MDKDKWEEFFIEYEEKELKIQKNRLWKLVLLQIAGTISTGLFIAWLIIRQL